MKWVTIQHIQGICNNTQLSALPPDSQTCLKKLVTVSVAGRKVAKLHTSSPTLIRSNPFFFLSFHVPWLFLSVRSKHVITETFCQCKPRCSVYTHLWHCMKMWMRLNRNTRVGVRVWPIQTTHTADNVEKVNGCPSKRHAITSKAATCLLCL